MAIPILRRYALKGAPFFDGSLRLALRGVDPHPFMGINASDVQAWLSLEHTSMADMASTLIGQLNDDPTTYQKGISTYVDHLAKQAIKQQKEAFGLDVATWSSQAKRRVYTNNFSTPDAHMIIVTSLEPSSQAKTAIKDPNLMRIAMGSFPGGFATINPDIYSKLIAGGRAIDGTPINVFQENIEKIIQENQKFYESKSNVVGTHMLGANSIIHSLNHDIFAHGGGTIQTALNMTSMLHSQHGIVPWSFYADPSFDGLVCTSLHLGRNPVIGGDVVNAAIAPLLFKNVFRRTTLFYNNLDRLTTLAGKEAVAQLLMNPKVANEFRNILAHEDFKMVTDAAILSTLDATGGALLNTLHLLTDTRVSLVDIDALMKANSCDDFNKLGEEGTQRAIAFGTLGEAGILRPKPTDLVPDFGMLEAGVIQNTTETPKNWGTCPMPSDLQDLRTKHQSELDSLSKKLDWEALQDHARSTIKDHALTALETFDTREVIGHTSEQLASALLNDTLKSTLASSLANTMEQQLLQDPSFQSFLETLSPDVATALSTAKQLFSLDITAARFQSSAMDAYLKATLITETASHKINLLQNHAGEIQKAATAIETDMGQTSSEKETAQKDLVAVQEKLKQAHPHDAPLLKAQEALLKEQLNDLAEQEDALEKQKETAEDTTQAQEHDRASEAEASAEKYGGEVFQHGE